MSTSWTASDVAAVERALASGAVKVEYDTHAVTYRSLEDLRQLLAMMRAEVGGSAPRVTHIQPSYSRGV